MKEQNFHNPCKFLHLDNSTSRVSFYCVTFIAISFLIRFIKGPSERSRNTSVKKEKEKENIAR